ncbi:MAG: PP2C family protein-serine/threonine phosphatase [Gammaproteobacteria bacterium]
MDAFDSDAIGGRILVVDDNEMNRDLLVRRLGRRAFDVDAVEDGAAALAAVDAERYDLVLLDIMMPGIDGYEVLEQIRRTRSASELPVIMVTAKDESADIVRALKLGANDYITKPIDFAVAVARVNTHIVLSHSQRALRAAHARMKHDLEAAAATQQLLLPSVSLDDGRVGFGWAYRPCDELAGDMLDVFRIDEHRVACYVLDVAGHGVRAALLSFAISHSMPEGGTTSDDILQPEQIAMRLNAEFPVTSNSGLIFTLLYGVLDLRDGRFSYISAGHPDPVRLTSAGAVELLSSVGGPPIGAIDDASFVGGEVVLEPGDRVVVVSDGVFEQPGADHERFGWDRYLDAIRRGRDGSATEAVGGIEQAVLQWAAEEHPQDDISIVALDFLGPARGG